MLIEGRWHPGDVRTPGHAGRFVRAQSAFRSLVTADGRSGFPAEAGRYHLFVSWACPWAHRTAIFRQVLELQDAISLSAVEALMLDDGWTFAAPDPVSGVIRLHELYTQSRPDYTGKVTVPILWDKRTRTIVNNESSEIIRMLSTEFAGLARRPYDFYPDALRAEIDAVNTRVYETVNNGVYRSGFATSQEAYEEAVTALFESLAWLDERLSTRRYLVGDRVTEADWRLFTTLVRFDAVYYGHFKCNLKHVYEHAHLWGYVRELYQWPGVAETVKLDEIKRHYYASHRGINPLGIVPLGPALDFAAAHGRGRLAAATPPAPPRP
jgi:glutathionyl-hydroquinone reductase